MGISVKNTSPYMENQQIEGAANLQEDPISLETQENMINHREI